jgi:hypothetical protein
MKWLQAPGVEQEFTAGIATDASITKCIYSLLVPRIPLTFSPSNDDHLREIEESNDLPVGVISKARWIKPEYRRTPEQRAAHAIFAFRDISIANLCIRDGITICGLRIRPSRLKQERQCMKCRQWGHFAYSCTAPVDTCGTCGGEHRSNECRSKDKTHCVSCKADDHAIWDRDCPESRRRCDQINENYPENNLPYFPTNEDWTLTSRPGRLQQTEKFPSRYAVSALQQPEQTHRVPATKIMSKQRKQHPSKVPANQSTMDQFIVPGNPQRPEPGMSLPTSQR